MKNDSPSTLHSGTTYVGAVSISTNRRAGGKVTSNTKHPASPPMIVIGFSISHYGHRAKRTALRHKSLRSVQHKDSVSYRAQKIP